MKNNFDCIHRSIADECMKGEMENWEECVGCDIEQICQNCTYQLENKLCCGCTHNIIKKGE